MWRQLIFPILQRHAFIPLLSVIFFSFYFPPVAQDDALDDVAQALIQKIASVLPARDPISFTLQNRSALTLTDVAAVRIALESALFKKGFHITPASQNSAHISFTLSESLAAYVWTAEVRPIDSANVFMVLISRDREPRAAQPSTSLAIRREFLWEQNQPILDLVFSNASSGERVMFILEPAQISVRRWQAGKWLPDSTIPLVRTAVPGRDPRGFLNYQVNSLSAVFDKEVCRQNASPNGGFKCEALSVPRPFLLDPLLSNDERVMAIEKKHGPALTSAKLGSSGRTVLLLTFSDGLTRMYEEGAEPVATFSGWGSELVAIQSGCGTGAQVLVTGKGDWNAPDTIQAHEIRDLQSVPVTAVLDFPGPVMSFRSESDSRAALAIIRNLTTHQYEAYHLSITCEK